ncbi:MAG: hypothetical protein GOVbin3661_37 [Prokaryotic dsDNA virus sp.]|nr:MAG: hypothetical protein GOVbin3661_37 [Prokaryotic dsDNA virus sp.]|tara:strand:+ start:132 stop:287 length:156 start_codon:yes stop_codon:yes gene_type:complete
MREFINAASATEVEALKKELMRSSETARKAYKLAILSIILQVVLITYLILK